MSEWRFCCGLVDTSVQVQDGALTKTAHHSSIDNSQLCPERDNAKIIPSWHETKHEIDDVLGGVALNIVLVEQGGVAVTDDREGQLPRQ
jgi:hypothetical protein